MLDAGFPRPVRDLLPHQGRAVVLDRLLSHDEVAGRVTCSVRLGPDAPYARNGRVRSLIGVEYMAQAAGVMIGLRTPEGATPSVGYLVGVQQLKLEVPWFELGQELIVTVQLLYRDKRAGSFWGEVCAGERVLVRGTLTVVERGES